MDRLGFPYKTGRQCESCPDSCEPVTNREYKKKLRNKSKRSVPEHEESTQIVQQQDKLLSHNQVGTNRVEVTFLKL